MIRKHPFLFFFLLLLVAGIVAAVIYARQPKAIPVRTTAVEQVDELISMVNASGEIRAHDMVDIQAEVAGVIKELPVKEGDKVKKGQMLLKIDDFQTSMELASQRGTYAAAQSEIRRSDQAIATAISNMERQRELIKSNESDLAQSEITLERDNASLKRYQELLKTRAISQDEYETVDSKARISVKRVEGSRRAISQAEEQLRALVVAVEEQKEQKSQAQQRLLVAEAALKRAQDQLGKTVIKAPMDSVIVTLNVDEGERAVPGIQSNPQATLMTLANLGQIEAELKVNETDIVRVKLGQTANVKVDALSDVTSLTGHVSEISEAPIDTNARGSSYSSSNNQEGKDFKVVIVIDNPPRAIRIGMLCEADITIETRKNVLSIPIAAITPRKGEMDDKGNYVPPPKPAKGQEPGKPAMADNKEFGAGGRGGGPGRGKGERKKASKKEFSGVFVKGADGAAHFRVVKTGIMGDMDVEVLEGLKEGEEVITGPLAALRQIDEWTLVRLETEAERNAATDQRK